MAAHPSCFPKRAVPAGRGRTRNAGEENVKNNRAVLLGLASLLSGCAYMSRQGTIFYMTVNSEYSAKEVEMEMEKPFLEKYRNRVTIDATFTVDKARATPNPPGLDGDIHAAGRAPQIALITVAEVANAASYPEAVALLNRADSTKRPLALTGVWRLWPEHSGSSKSEQGKPVEAVDTYRPDHVFEIHPVTRLNRINLLESFTPVKGFSPGVAPETFVIFEKTVCKIIVKPKAISIVTRKGLYNDVEFVMEITGDRPLVVEDGRFVTASALDMGGKVLAEHIRMVFAKGTPPERAVRNLKKGARLHVFGMPRINAAEVLRRVRASDTDPVQLTWPVPYEIVILGVFPDEKAPS
jgi:hypothetical protein